MAENLLLRQQLLILPRSRKRAPNLSSFDRFFLGLWSTFLDPRRIKRVTVLVQPVAATHWLNRSAGLENWSLGSLPKDLPILCEEN